MFSEIGFWESTGFYLFCLGLFIVVCAPFIWYYNNQSKFEQYKQVKESIPKSKNIWWWRFLLIIGVLLLLKAMHTPTKEENDRDLDKIRQLRTDREAYEQQQRRIDQYIELRTQPIPK